MPLVSIIVPVYNVEPFLQRCVDSVLQQTIHDFELILVDDGSFDRSPQICDSYAKLDTRVHVIHKKNHGVAAARNTGMEVARGKYILFCDSDDYVSKDWCKHFMSYIAKNQNKFIFCGINRVNNIADSVNSAVTKEHIYNLDESIALHGRNEIGYVWNAIFQSDILHKYCIKFPENKIAEDLPFVLEYLSHMDGLINSGYYDYYYYTDERETLSKRYYPESFQKWKEKYEYIQHFIDLNFDVNKKNELKKQAADIYLFHFLDSLNNTFDNRNKKNILEKIQYNSAVVKTKEFQDCLYHADTTNENVLYIKLLKGKKYILAYILTKITQLKGRMARK